MIDREKVIKGLGRCGKGNMCRYHCPYDGPENDIKNCTSQLARDALELLKAQELPAVKPEKLEEVTTKWLDEMTAEERLKKIALILDDWDGYRTAKGLAGLINEVWAYALYPVKEQEPRVMKKEEITKSEVVWLECKNICDNKLVAALPWLPIDIRDDTWDFQTNTNVETMFLDEYKKTWRCWTSRPTDEQREAVKWDG